jgi:hypothetical protein
MHSDVISWFFYENSKKDPMERSYSHQIPKNADISITSSLFIYNVVSPKEQNFESSSTFVDNDSPFVLLDEIYRPGKGVDVKRNFYGVWREDINVGAAQMLSFIESNFALKLSHNDSSKRSQDVTDVDFKDNLLITNNEKWERRKDLTGVVLKTTTNAVTLIYALITQ